ncbi:hypothetical protein D3C71_2051740 [compost metagenome]
MLCQPGVQAPGEATEVLILPVTQAKDRVIEAGKRCCLAQHFTLETTGTVRRLAIAKGADDEQRIA